MLPGRTVTADGYVLIFTPSHPHANSRGRVPEHRLIAEKAVGKILPRSVKVHHHDENKSNNANSNLVICQDHHYHALLHQRMRTLQAGFDPNEYLWCSDGRHYCRIEDFAKSKRERSGRLEYSTRCKSCSTVKSNRERLTNKTRKGEK